MMVSFGVLHLSYTRRDGAIAHHHVGTNFNTVLLLGHLEFLTTFNVVLNCQNSQNILNP